MKYLAIAAISLALAGCATDVQQPERAAAGPAGNADAAADVRDAAGQSRARVSADQVGDSIRLRILATGLAAGSYAAHIHTAGRCDPPAFESAGGHWNPTNRQHGKNNPQGMHQGDLPNLLIGPDGRGSLEYLIAGAWLSAGAMPMLDADGAALVIHQRADDHRTDPSGNAGTRIACGVFG